MSNILKFVPKLNYTKSDFQTRVSVSTDEYFDFDRYTAIFYIKTTASGLTPTSEVNMGQLVVDSDSESAISKIFTVSFNYSGDKKVTVTCLCVLTPSGVGSIEIQSVDNPTFYDGTLKADSFTITTHSRYDDTDEGEDYYSYYASVVIKTDIQPFFIAPLTINTGYSPSDYGNVEYSTSVTFTTKNAETVTVYLTLHGNNGSCSATFNGVSPQ